MTEKLIGERFLVVCEVEDDEYGPARFSIYTALGSYTEDPDTPVYEGLRGAGWDAHATTEIDEARKAAHGFVKWDGCVNWDINEDEQIACMMHHCDFEDLESFTEAIRYAYKECARLIPNFDGKLP